MAVKKLLNSKKHFSITSKNIGAQKQYKDQYIEVVKQIKIPRDICQLIYSSRYAKHFYSDEMLNNFIKRWTKE